MTCKAVRIRMCTTNGQSVLRTLGAMNRAPTIPGAVSWWLARGPLSTVAVDANATSPDTEKQR
jgi:hypothetical protein